jgi:hypothetical protein
MKSYIRVAGFAALLLASAQASAGHVVIEANGARANDRWGGEFGAGYSLDFHGFHLTPAVGAFVYRGDNDRFYEDSNGGNQRCRDSTNGHYAKNSDCDNAAVKAYGRIEATYTIPLFATVGAGARYSGSHVRPYGTAMLPLGPVLSIKANGGPHYGALGLRAGF